MAAVQRRIENSKAGAQCRSMDCVFDQDAEVEALFTGTGQLDLAGLLDGLMGPRVNDAADDAAAG